MKNTTVNTYWRRRTVLDYVKFSVFIVLGFFVYIANMFGLLFIGAGFYYILFYKRVQYEVSTEGIRVTVTRIRNKKRSNVLIKFDTTHIKGLGTEQEYYSNISKYPSKVQLSAVEYKNAPDNYFIYAKKEFNILLLVKLTDEQLEYIKSLIKSKAL